MPAQESEEKMELTVSSVRSLRVGELPGATQIVSGICRRLKRSVDCVDFRTKKRYFRCGVTRPDRFCATRFERLGHGQISNENFRDDMMTGYTVHTGATKKFVSGWDNIFADGKKKAQQSSDQSQTSAQKKKTKKKKKH